MPGRIPQEFINDLLQRVDIVELIGERLELKKRGRNYFALCPFHGEKTPSFSINPERQAYHCFGCGVNGTAITFLMEYENLDFVPAVETLAARQGLNVPREGGPARKRPQHDRLYAALADAERYYRRQLKSHAAAGRAQGYLKGRGITGEVAAAFGIGFAPPGWENLKSALDQEQTLLEAGLLSRNEAGRTYDRFRDRVVFPIRDARGRVIGFGGRVIDAGEPKYLNSPETPVFQKGHELYGLYEARRLTKPLERLLLVEGYMDVVALSQHGITDVVATLGTASTPAHFEKLFRTVPTVVCCFDGDEAGRRAAWKALTTALPLLRDGLELRFLLLPEGEDPDSLVRREGAEAFLRRVENAAPFSEFFFDHLTQELTVESLEGKARLSKTATALLKPMPKGVLKDLMYKRLGELSSVAPEGFERQPSAAGRRVQRTKGRVTGVAERTLALLLRFPKFATEMRAGELELLAGLKGDDERLLTGALGHVRAGGEEPSAALVGQLAADGVAQERLQALSRFELPLDADAQRAEFRDGIDALLKRATREIPMQEALERFRAEPSAENWKRYEGLRSVAEAAVEGDPLAEEATVASTNGSKTPTGG